MDILGLQGWGCLRSLNEPCARFVAYDPSRLTDRVLGFKALGYARRRQLANGNNQCHRRHLCVAWNSWLAKVVAATG